MSDGPNVPFTEILKSIPGVFGIRLEEQPKFDILEDKDGIEVRRYQPALMAQVTVTGPRKKAVSDAFDHLAKFIFGENAEGKKMPMTSPVFQMPEGDDGVDGDESREWTVAFFLSNETTKEEAPEPNDPAVKLHLEPARLVAATRFSGNNTDEGRTEAREKLLTWLAGRQDYTREGELYWAQFDAPFVIPFLKKNEAMMGLQQRSGTARA